MIGNNGSGFDRNMTGGPPSVLVVILAEAEIQTLTEMTNG